ncbi:hypothetical protein CROQUDRAFT_660974 [Cronartium quercuum f. sp. fusiforme G11]|uniref:Uncharacterized protein n=1 Tax=Cronartium quercuum f. sp. fusiforme G11 TaxID=708437 RepID=A0A9P6NGD1_9BASI|nr:hypothetical protein CROQUDRAFT_660974 [Cronartium quercuum f. sp. fusiforme G11]
MPSSSSFTAAEKATIKKTLPNSYHKILAAGFCRIYYAYPDPNRWSFTGLSGALVFGRSTSNSSGQFWFKLVDVEGTRGTIWEHELYEDGSGHPGKGMFGYFQERTFWHTFQGDDCMIGFVFSNEDEATTLFKKVNTRSKYINKYSRKSTAIESPNPPASPVVVSGKKKGGIDKSMISAPSGFRRVAHMGYDSTNGFTTENVDPSWAQLLTNLSSMGFSKDDINKNEDFIREFVSQAGGVNQILATPATQGRSGTGPPPPPVSRVPPPTVAAPITSKRVKPPAPPAPRRSGTLTNDPPDQHQQSLAQTITRPPSNQAPSRPAPPILPSPATRSNAPPPAPPPPPPPLPASNAAPPPPPPPAALNTAPPPPPPPAALNTAPPPPPPPPATSAAPTSLPPVTGARADLLASIQGKGIHVLKKTPQGATSEPQSNALNRSASSVTEGAGASGGTNLAASLAAALNKRKGTMGDDSDEEGGGSDDEWD